MYFEKNGAYFRIKLPCHFYSIKDRGYKYPVQYTLINSLKKHQNILAWQFSTRCHWKRLMIKELSEEEFISFLYALAKHIQEKLFYYIFIIILFASHEGSTSLRLKKNHCSSCYYTWQHNVEITYSLNPRKNGNKIKRTHNISFRSIYSILHHSHEFEYE